MADEMSPPLPDWISEVLDRWVPPEDYDARLSAIVDGYASDRSRAVSLREPDRLRRPA